MQPKETMLTGEFINVSQLIESRGIQLQWSWRKEDRNVNSTGNYTAI